MGCVLVETRRSPLPRSYAFHIIPSFVVAHSIPLNEILAIGAVGAMRKEILTTIILIESELGSYGKLLKKRFRGLGESGAPFSMTIEKR